LTHRREGLGGHFIAGKSPTALEEPGISSLDVDYTFFDQQVWPDIASRVPAFQNIKVALGLRNEILLVNCQNGQEVVHIDIDVIHNGRKISIKFQKSWRISSCLKESQRILRESFLQSLLKQNFRNF